MLEAVTEAESLKIPRLLDVGAGCHPDSYKLRRDNLARQALKISTDDTSPGEHIYVGLNVDPRQHFQRLDWATSQAENNFSIFVDLRKKDASHELTNVLGDSSFSTVRFANVFGELHSSLGHYSDLPEVNPNGQDYIGGSRYNQKLVSVLLATRYLEPGGWLIIREDLTPFMADVDHFEVDLKKTLPDLGFDEGSIEYNFSHVNQTLKDDGLVVVENRPMIEMAIQKSA